MYLEATGIVPGLKAQLLSPLLPLFGYDKCLKFIYNARGRHVGDLNVLDGNLNELLSIHSGKPFFKHHAQLFHYFFM